MQTYQLASHVRACVAGDTVVFLDLRADHYLSVALERAPYICGLTSAEAKGSGDRLRARGLIENHAGDVAPRARTRSPVERLFVEEQVKPNLDDALRVLACCAITARALASRRLDLVLGRLDALKRRRRVLAAPAEQVASIFEAVRPWYPRSRVCLFDALALMRFLLHAGVRPDLVIGVRTKPFAAHCWLEVDGKLASDASDYCASFEPIAWI